ncbi:double-region [Aliidongia dinghuensis]|uniref:Double-region n=1 Tax=Aliidongia dinghuensis TaxID=1867774 RepID=A0A8J3E133_9PROT|nr:double-region [Aliidongia dinghuensis]
MLWWLIRVTPPAPTIVRFPAIRLLMGLNPADETPAKTPWWLILLRLVIASLLIVGLAHPLLNPAAELPGAGPVVLVVDDGWASAANWPEMQRRADEIIDQADRADRRVVLVTTAAGQPAEPATLQRPADARGRISGLAPKPWPTDRAAAAERLKGLPIPAGATIFYLADGLDDRGGVKQLFETLRGLGPVRLVVPPDERLARLIEPGPGEAKDLTVRVERATQGEAPTVRLRAASEDGRQIAEAEGQFRSDSTTLDVAIPMPSELRNRVGRIEIEGEASAGATELVDESSRRRPVGIATDRPSGSSQPLLSDTYYLDRALSPFAELRHGTVTELLGRSLTLLVLPDGDPGPPEQDQAIGHWIEAGGVLLRFAGPTMAQREDDNLLPVMLRRGGRTIGGAMSWEKPAHLAEFPAGTPFAGLPVPADVTVDRQVLAEPAVDLASKTWARLTDGTPLVTAQQRGKGWLVLVHTSANTAWSNLALSGLFVDMLRRLVQLGQGVEGTGDAVLPPWRVLDGYGHLGAPLATAQPLNTAEAAKITLGPAHPPGFYGNETTHRALNLGPTVPSLAAFGSLPVGVVAENYTRMPEVDLRPGLLGAALLLGLIDILIGYGLRGLLRPRRAGLAGVLIALALAAAPAQAAPPQSAPQSSAPASATNGPDAFTVAATSELRLAYVVTGDGETDAMSKAGLVGLGNVLSRRTAVEAGDPMAVDVEADELIFFPLIYWPITGTQKPLSPAAAERVNRYLATGGTILFDTRDQGTGLPGAYGVADTARRLQTLLAGVKIPPLVAVPADHVLTKSFYLMQDFPGRWIGGTLWVEPAEDRTNDGVSTVVVGANDWAGAWAVDGQGFPSLPVVPGGEAQREQAYRFGVNLVMYALTGNYKADQVHVPAILERLGQ